MKAPVFSILAARAGRYHALWAAGVILAALVSIRAEATQEDRRESVMQRSDKGRQLSVASRLISEKRYDEAIAVLEPVVEENPELRAAAERLAICYQRAGRPHDAIRLLEERIASDPYHLPFVRTLGYAYLDIGERDKAIETWHSVLDDDPKRAGYYGTIAQLEKEAGLYEEALSTYRAGRRNEAFFRRNTAEIIRLERLLGRPGVAFEETVVLISWSQQFNAADVDLAVELFAEEDRDEGLLEFVDSAAADAPRGNTNMAVLKTALLFDAGRYDEAVELLEQLGSSGEREIFAIVGYLVRARQRGTVSGNDPVLRKALETFLEDHGASPVAPGIMFVLAEDLRSQAASGTKREAALREALDVIDRILEHPKSGFYREPALLLEAEILLEGLHRPDGAIEALEGAEFRAADRAREAERLIMNALIEAGRWKEAERRFTLLSGDVDSVKAAIGRYGMGKLRFYRGEYGAAVDSLSRFAESHPWSEYANDALETAMLVKEALVEDTAPLDCYRGAYVALAQGMVRTAADSLDAFQQRYPLSLLIPRAIFMRAEIHLIDGDPEAAAGLWKGLAEAYPLHGLAPRALERTAEIAGPGESVELYEKIIERYPDDPFIGRIRNRYIALRKSIEENAGDD
jgi:tetratricopeptide (TPR) repeat protein